VPRDPQPEAELDALRNSCRSLILATTDTAGTPQASPAPFVRDAQNRYHVFVSSLSPHTAHLASGRPIGILLVEDESDALQIFARRRLSHTCAVEEIERSTTDWDACLVRFGERFGAVIDLLRDLPDFRLFRLMPKAGRFVRGFGQAYRIVDESLQAIGPRDEGDG
jgi:heme iron utilization protein